MYWVTRAACSHFTLVVRRKLFDLVMSFRLGSSSIYWIFHETLLVLRDDLQVPGAPTKDTENIRVLADEFRRYRSTLSLLYGCVGAMDRISEQIEKPYVLYVPRNYFCRKGFYSRVVQAAVECKLRFKYMSCMRASTAHGSTAFGISFQALTLW